MCLKLSVIQLFIDFARYLTTTFFDVLTAQCKSCTVRMLCDVIILLSNYCDAFIVFVCGFLKLFCSALSVYIVVASAFG